MSEMPEAYDPPKKKPTEEELYAEIERLYHEKEVLQKEYDALQLKHNATVQYVRQAIDFCRTSILINIG